MAQYIKGPKPYQPRSFKTGTITVETTASQGPNVVVAPGCAVMLYAPITNTTNVAVGGDNTVTLSTGLNIEPGASAIIQVDNLNRLYFIAGATDQTLLYATESE